MYNINSFYAQLLTNLIYMSKTLEGGARINKNLFKIGDEFTDDKYIYKITPKRKGDPRGDIAIIVKDKETGKIINDPSVNKKEFEKQFQEGIFTKVEKQEDIEAENKNPDSKKETEKEIENKIPKENEENIKTFEDVRKEIDQDFDKAKKEQSEVKNEKLLSERMSVIGISSDTLKDNEEWQKLETPAKLLAIEQISQNTLSQVKEIGEQRFQEKNKISLSWNPKKWEPLSLGKKVWNKFTKAYWISEEEKQVLKEAEEGKIQPDKKTTEEIIHIISDMKLDIENDNGRAKIVLEKVADNMSPEEKAIIEKYNEASNSFMRMPDKWRNERSAKSTDDSFKQNKNFDIYNKTRDSYEKAKGELLKIKTKEYKEKGAHGEEEARILAMTDLNNDDLKIKFLQWSNTNPDATKELNKIREDSSVKRLWSNENIWRGIYIGVGYGMRTATAGTIGLLAAPVVGGAIGGWRARNKAGANVDKAFLEGRTEKTFMERKMESGVREELKDKNLEKGVIAKTLGGKEINTKEVAGFIDADSQIQRIENLEKKLEKAEKLEEKNKLISQINSRVDYIRNKIDGGLVNYGKENPIASNYKLMQKMCELSVLCETKKMEGRNDEDFYREHLLGQVMKYNKKKFGEKEANYKNAEMLRGAAIGAGGAMLGWWLRGLQDGNVDTGELINNGSGPIKLTQEQIDHANKIFFPETPHASVSAVADHGQGAISTLRELQNNLKAEYGDISKAPESVRHILNTDAHKLAQEYGMYDPNQTAESAMVKLGSTFKVDENGNLIYQEGGSTKSIILESGNETKTPEVDYSGKMFDSDHSGSKIIDNKIEGNLLHKSQFEIDNPQENPAVISDNGREALSGNDLVNRNSSELTEFEKNNPQVNPEDGEAIAGGRRYSVHSRIRGDEGEDFNPVDNRRYSVHNVIGDDRIENAPNNFQQAENLNYVLEKKMSLPEAMDQFRDVRETQIDKLSDLKDITSGYEEEVGQPSLRNIMKITSDKDWKSIVSEDVGETVTSAKNASSNKLSEIMLDIKGESMRDYYFNKTLPNGNVKVVHIKFYK